MFWCVKNGSLLVLIVLIHLKAVASLDIYTGMSMGEMTMSETQGGSSYSHASTFFVGHWGFGLGGRWKMDLGDLGVGVLGELAWVGDSTQRTLAGTVNNTWNRFESYRVLGGGVVSYNFAKTFVFSAEYYPSVVNTVTFSDGNQDNPFRQNDKLTATGFGVGFTFDYWGNAPAHLMYRRFMYKEVQMAGVDTVLPTSRYTTEVKVEDIFVGVLKTF